MSLSEQLLYLRSKYDLKQSDMADIAGVSKGAYQAIERGNTSDQSKMAKKVQRNVLRNKKAIQQHFEAERRKTDKRRIPNIPDFYERLDCLCDAEGGLVVDKNHPQLQELRMLVGGNKVMTSGRKKEEFK